THDGQQQTVDVRGVIRDDDHRPIGQPSHHRRATAGTGDLQAGEDREDGADQPGGDGIDRGPAPTRMTPTVHGSRNSVTRRTKSHAPSEVLAITVRVTWVVGSCIDRNETPAS